MKQICTFVWYFVINGFIFSITTMAEFSASEIDSVSTCQENQIEEKFKLQYYDQNCSKF